MLATQRLIKNRDDPGGPVQSIGEIIIHTRIRAIGDSATEHLSVSGWYDSRRDPLQPNPRDNESIETMEGFAGTSERDIRPVTELSIALLR